MQKYASLFLLVFMIACGSTTATLVPSPTLAPQPTSIAEPTAAPATQLFTPTTNAPPPPSTAAIVPAAQPSATVVVAPTLGTGSDEAIKYEISEFAAPPGSRPHDVAPAADGGIWYTAQGQGALGYLDVKTGKTRQIPLGAGSAPHGVILGPDGAPWITDGGLNAIVRVDPSNDQVEVFPLPTTHPRANLNTAVFDKTGVLWFTGQAGVYGKLDPKIGQVEAWDAPRGTGPYGITTTPNGDIFYASLAGSHIARINPQTNEATMIEPPTPRQGARRVWSDSQGRVWVSEWNAGQVAVYDPANNTWQEWKLPGNQPLAYAVYVDENDQVWLSDFAGNALVHFDPATEKFDVYPLPSPSGNVRQIHGRAGEVWGAESGADKIIVARAE